MGTDLHRTGTVITDRGADPPPSTTARDLDRRQRLVVGLGVAALWGVVAGLWTPRGPLTTSEAVWSIAISLVVGGTAGYLSGSRWMILLAPLGSAVAFEATRLGTDGPMTDAIHLSTYGVMALVLGRGVHALLMLAPLITGAAFGAGLARRARAVRLAGGPPETGPGGLLRRAVAVLACLALVALTAGLLRPASTEQIRAAGGQTVPGSVAELTTVTVDGHDLALMIRGQDVANPVLLFLAGGPGGSELGAMRNHLAELERHVTVVTWDQRGTGKSYPELDPTGTLTLENAVVDTLAVTDYVRERFGKSKIYLAGQSWGSTLGVLTVQRAPERYLAFVGVGQMVSQLATDTIFYRDTLAWADRTGHAELSGELRRIGPPPYASVLDYETALSYEHEVYPYDHSANSEGQGGFSENLLAEEYTLLEQLHLLPAFMDTFTVMYPQLQEIDFRWTATSFEVPVFFVQGAHEAPGRADVFAEWYPSVSAPIKDLAVLETSGHRPLFEQPHEFVDYVVGTVLARTAP